MCRLLIPPEEKDTDFGLLSLVSEGSEVLFLVSKLSLQDPAIADGVNVESVYG